MFVISLPSLWAAPTRTSVLCHELSPGCRWEGLAFPALLPLPLLGFQSVLPPPWVHGSKVGSLFLLQRARWDFRLLDPMVSQLCGTAGEQPQTICSGPGVTVKQVSSWWTRTLAIRFQIMFMCHGVVFSSDHFWSNFKNVKKHSLPVCCARPGSRQACSGSRGWSSATPCSGCRVNLVTRVMWLLLCHPDHNLFSTLAGSKLAFLSHCGGQVQGFCLFLFFLTDFPLFAYASLYLLC